MSRFTLRTVTATFRAATAVSAVVAAATAMVLTSPAQATATAQAGGPAFLSPEQLPSHPSSSWYAGDVTKGLPDVTFCLAGALPEKGASYRDYWTQHDTAARQIIIKAADKRKAEKIATAANQSIRDCAEKWMDTYPDEKAESRYYGWVDVEDGTDVHGVQTSDPETTNDIHLFGVGRNGKVVTVLDWGEMGEFKDAPVNAFKNSMYIAVEKLDG